MAITGSSQDLNYKHWRKTPTVVLIGFVAYGLTLGAIAELGAWSGAFSTAVLEPFNYPGTLAFFVIQGLLGQSDVQPTIFIPTFLAWSLIGLIIYALLRFKAAIVQTRPI
jgi:hypothetical protein